MKMKTMIAASALLVATAFAGSTAHADDDTPRLVVVLSIDQFRGDYIARFKPFFGENGFNRILRDGRRYSNCHYLSANTETGPGHATMLTGAYANANGITANAWFDSRRGKSVYCVADDDARAVTTEGLSRPEEDASGVLPKATIYRPTKSSSPRNLRAETVGDLLETRTQGKSKTLSISAKDRSAILMAGHAADLATWFDNRRGEFVSSNYYGDALPPWLVAFNKAKPADKWFKKAWDLSLPREKYEQACTIDDYPAESTGGYSTRTFPHILGEKSVSPDAEFYGNIYGSPFSNDLVVDAAIAGLEAESLGKDDIPDLLTLSFSCNDSIGHAFGPDSWEVMDTTIKTDAVIARLLDALDAQAGKGNWTLFVTADHGIPSFPEIQREHRIDAERVLSREFEARLEEHIENVYGPPAEGRKYVLSVSDPWVTLDESATTATLSSELPPIEFAAAAFLNVQPEVNFAMLTRTLLESPNPTDHIQQGLLYAHYPGRSGQVAFVLKPNYYFSSAPVGTTHGSPYRYDQYVPMLACGVGIRPGRTSEPVSPPQIAPTVSLLLGLPFPNLCQVPPLPGALD